MQRVVEEAPELETIGRKNSSVTAVETGFIKQKEFVELLPGQKKSGSSVYGYLLSDEDVSLWYRQLQRGSEYTAENYLKRLGRFCEKYDLTPKGYLTLSKKKREDYLIRYIDELCDATNPSSGEAYSPSYVGTYVKAVQSWARFSGSIFSTLKRSMSYTKRSIL